MREVLGCDPVSGKLFRKDDLKYLFKQNSASSASEEILDALSFALCLKQRKKMDGWAAGWAVEGYLSAVKLDPSITRAIMIRFMVDKADFSVLIYERVSFVIENFAEKDFFRFIFQMMTKIFGMKIGRKKQKRPSCLGLYARASGWLRPI